MTRAGERIGRRGDGVGKFEPGEFLFAPLGRGGEGLRGEDAWETRRRRFAGAFDIAALKDAHRRAAAADHVRHRQAQSGRLLVRRRLQFGLMGGVRNFLPASVVSFDDFSFASASLTFFSHVLLRSMAASSARARATRFDPL